MGPETRRRSTTVRWTSSSGDGDAAEAVAEIEAWLATGPTREADWAGMAPLLADDASARTILLRLAEAEDAAALDAGVAALGARIDALLAERGAAAERAALAGPRTVAEMRATESRRHPAPRSLLRL